MRVGFRGRVRVGLLLSHRLGPCVDSSSLLPLARWFEMLLNRVTALLQRVQERAAVFLHEVPIRACCQELNDLSENAPTILDQAADDLVSHIPCRSS